MKRRPFFLSCSVFAMILVFGLFAHAQKPECQLRGSDVLVPDDVIQAISNFEPNKPVYAACDLNGWLIDSKKATKPILERTQMVQERDGSWRAKNMRGERFNAAQLGVPGKYVYENVNWAQLHIFLPASWLKTEGGIAIFLK